MIGVLEEIQGLNVQGRILYRLVIPPDAFAM